MTINPSDLPNVLASHDNWLRGEVGGSRADLRGADLSGAKGNMQELFSLQLDTWPIAYTKDVMQIGCQRHALTDWWGFSDEQVARMESRAPGWWAKWKPVLKQIVEMTVGEPK